MEAVVKQYPQLRGVFDFPHLNNIQQACLPLIMTRSDNLIVCAPTSSGKTVLFELAIAKHLPSSPHASVPTPLCLYLAPIKSLCHEKYTQW
jgi:ATP-dependent DNA helicase HFM1/MER3